MQADGWARRERPPTIPGRKGTRGSSGPAPNSQPGGDGRAALALLTLPARREDWSGLGRAPSAGPAPRAPSARARRGREEVSVPRCRDCLLLGRRKPRSRRRGPGRLWLRARRGVSGWGPAGGAAIQAAFCSRPRPPGSARRAPFSLLPRRRPPQPRAPRAARPRRGRTPSRPAASALRFVEPEPARSRVTGAASSPRALSAAGPARPGVPVAAARQAGKRLGVGRAGPGVEPRETLR